jgi:NAD(P)-dependent dehydrogenase (short-subunit alcohol dehydrogenase family)
VLVVGAGTRPLPDDPDPPIGNGRAIALLAAREGARVACADRDRASAADTAGRIEGEGGRADVLVADVTDDDACSRLVTDALDVLGGLEGLVLNVGVGAGARLEGTTPEVWDQVFAVNVRAHFLVCREALPRMEEGGSIVFISSVAGLTPGSMLPAYDASKAAVAGLCRHVGLEGSRRRIRANVVAPGLMDTPIGRAASRGRSSRDRTPVPLGRQGTAWEVAYPTVFLLSDEAGYITGQVLVSDGGLTALR